MVGFRRMGLHQRMPSLWIHNLLMVHPGRIQCIHHLSEIAGRYDIVVGALPKVRRRILLPHVLINAEVIDQVAPSSTAHRIKKSLVLYVIGFMKINRRIA